MRFGWFSRIFGASRASPKRKFRPESAKKVIGLTTAISSFRLLHPVIMFLTPVCTDLAARPRVGAC